MTKDKSFSYSDIIKTPDELHSGTSAKDLGHNISALQGYTSLLLTSDSIANSLQGHALGNQTWVRTNATCTAQDTGESKQRYIYIDNQPNTNTPPNKNDTTKNVEFNGLVPGIIDDIFKIMPSKLFTAFGENGSPECIPATLSITDKMTIDKDGNKLEQHETNYITLDDIKQVSGCSFMDGINPYNKDKKCPFKPAKESFKNVSNVYNLPKDNAVRLYFTTLSIIILYMLYCFIKKTSK